MRGFFNEIAVLAIWAAMLGGPPETGMSVRFPGRKCFCLVEVLAF
jgi:hypothetical protein